MKSLIQLGRIETNHVAKRIGQGKAISPMFLSSLVAMISAAFSASIKNGIGHVFLSVIRERTNPGQMTETLMFSGFNARRRASPHALTQALLALYEGQDFNP